MIYKKLFAEYFDAQKIAKGSFRIFMARFGEGAKKKI